MRPISSMCPANMTRGTPSGFTVATELPVTSLVTRAANESASARHTRAGAVSNPEGPGVSRRGLRKASEAGFMVSSRVMALSYPIHANAYGPRRPLLDGRDSEPRPHLRVSQSQSPSAHPAIQVPGPNHATPVREPAQGAGHAGRSERRRGAYAAGKIKSALGRSDGRTVNVGARPSARRPV